MANSDNVLRGGLTSKHVDVPELARVLQFAALEDPEAPRTQSGSTTDFDVPGEYFRVSRHHLGAGEALRADWDGPAVVLCTAGGTAELSPGQAVWIPASDTAANLTAGEAGADLFYVRV